MLLTCQNIIKILPIVRLELYNNKESNFIIPTNTLVKVLTVLKNHFKLLHLRPGAR